MDLPLSPSKTKLLRLGKESNLDGYFIQGIQVTEVDEVTDLGFHFTKRFQFDKHYEIISAKAMNRVFNLFRSLATADPRVLLKAYKIYVRPISKYGSVLFNNPKAKNINLDRKILADLAVNNKEAFAKIVNMVKEK